MKPLSEVAPGLLDIQIQIQAVWLKSEINVESWQNKIMINCKLEKIWQKICPPGIDFMFESVQLSCLADSKQGKYLFGVSNQMTISS